MFSDIFLESLTNSDLKFLGKITDAATNGPANAPRPTSSIPQIFFKWLNFLTFFKLKNLLIVFIPFFLEILTTLLDGSIPIIFINENESPGLISGGVLNTVRRKIDLICKINNIPEKLEANLKDLEVGSVVHMSDIKLPEDVSSVIADRDFTIATIAAPTIMKVEDEKPEEGEEDEEDQ